MKNPIIKSIIFSLGLLAFSCESLEEDPVGLLAPEGFFKGPDEVSMGINGGYSIMLHEQFWGRKLSLSLLLRGDMATIGTLSTPARRIEVDEMRMPGDNDMVSAFWPKGYQSLAALNYAIAGGEALDLDPNLINPIIAEGKFYRAWIYYHFVRLFGEIPYINYPFADQNLAYSLPQTPEDEIYEGIIEDLEYAKEWLPANVISRSHPGKGTAAGYLASVYLTLGEWQNAYDEAKFVIDNSGSFNYNLEGEFADLFDPSSTISSTESLFEIDFTGNDAGTNPGALGGTNASSDYLASVTGITGDERYEFGAGWSVAVPSMKVYESWDYRDYRRAVSFDTVMLNGGTELHYTQWGSVTSAIPRPHIAKYYRALGESGAPAGSNGRDSEINSIVMRYAEVLLIAAEALNEVNGGPTAEAEGYINEVRSRARRELDSDPANDTAYPADVSSGLDVNDFRDLVLDERRLELAFEFGRWYDIKRRQLGEVVFGVSGLEQQNFDASRDYLFPKYAEDVSRNKNLFQNVNY